MARIEADLIIDGGRAIVSIGGALDCSNAHRVGSLLRRLLKEGCADIVVDLAALERIDSAGIGILRGANNAVAPAGRLGQVNAPPAIAEVLAEHGIVTLDDASSPADDEPSDESDVRGRSAPAISRRRTVRRDLRGRPAPSPRLP